MKPKWVHISDRMQRAYAYRLTEPMGKNFHPDFRPELTPKKMLALGIFGGRYMTDCRDEFPSDWFVNAKLCAERHDPKLNFFVSTPRSRCLFGERKAGYITRILEAGFSGIVDISSAGVAPMTNGRYADGGRSAAT